MTVIGDAVPVLDPEAPPVVDVHDAAYDVIGLPPLLAGALNATVIEALPLVALVIVGAPGTVAGITAADAADGPLVPIALVAVTVQV